MSAILNEKIRRGSLVKNSGLVAGEWRQSKYNKAFPIYEPASGTILWHCADLDRQDFLDAIESATVGTSEFAEYTAKARAGILQQWYELVMEHTEDLATILSLENGKTYLEAKGEITYAASFISWFAGEAVRSYGDTIPSSYPNTTVLTYKEPVGVCGIITPWNFPAAMITRKVAPALAAGCSVIIKPPSETPLSALAFAHLALEAGVPANCIHVIPTKDRQASMELAVNPKVKKLSFTGSTGVGKILTKAAAETMKRVSMELGGNAPFIVFEDADIDQAVEGAMICKFRCSGQTCVVSSCQPAQIADVILTEMQCANRLFVHEDVKHEFAQKLASKVQQLKLGRGIDDGVTQGPLVNRSAVQKVDQHVQDALKKGGKLHIGGRTPPGLTGYFYEPTVISEATVDMQVAHDETFGPLAAIFPFRTEEEAVRLANNTEYGLAGYFFSKNVGRVMRVARELNCGMVGVNTGLISAAETPFGGINESGLGREGSKYGLAEYQNIKSVTIGNLDD